MLNYIVLIFLILTPIDRFHILSLLPTLARSTTTKADSIEPGLPINQGIFKFFAPCYIILIFLITGITGPMENSDSSQNSSLYQSSSLNPTKNRNWVVCDLSDKLFASHPHQSTFLSFDCLSSSDSDLPSTEIHSVNIIIISSYWVLLTI